LLVALAEVRAKNETRRKPKGDPGEGAQREPQGESPKGTQVKAPKAHPKWGPVLF